MVITKNNESPMIYREEAGGWEFEAYFKPKELTELNLWGFPEKGGIIHHYRDVLNGLYDNLQDFSAATRIL